MSSSTAAGTPRALLARYHQAMLDQSADALAELYAIDGVHEFPLLSPFFPQRLHGREEVRRHYAAVWGAASIRIVEMREIAVHETSDPNVIVGEAEFTAEATELDKTFV